MRTMIRVLLRGAWVVELLPRSDRRRRRRRPGQIAAGTHRKPYAAEGRPRPDV